MQRVERSILARRLIRPGQRVLVAVSGGVDSMVLLQVLHELASEHQWQLTVAHLNHRLRGRNSDADERLVRRTGERLGLPVVVEAADVRALAQAQQVSLEMAARNLRHDFLASAARQRRIPVIALAHHADDQIELFFLRLLRGSGGEGLAGMKWRNPSPSDRHVQLVRPLLDQPKAVLKEYAAEKRIRFREDASNALLDIQRNRIRYELLPLLRRRYQPALERTVARVMEIVGEEAEFVSMVATEWVQGLGSPKAEGQGKSEVRSPKSEGVRASLRPPSAVLLRRTGRLLRAEAGKQGNPLFEDLPVAVQRQGLRRQLLDLGIEPDFELVEQLRQQAGRPVNLSLGQASGDAKPTRTGPRQVVGGTRQTGREHEEEGTGGPPARRYAVRERSGRVRLQAEAPAGFSFSSANVNIENRVGAVEFDGVRVSWRIDSSKAVARPRAGISRECFDADRVGSLVRVRHWQPGDRFQPIGMSRAVKLQDFFTNQRIPRDQRRQLLVAATARGEVFWVEGARISERFKLTRQTNRRLQWSWKRL